MLPQMPEMTSCEAVIRFCGWSDIPVVRESATHLAFAGESVAIPVLGAMTAACMVLSSLALWDLPRLLGH